MMNLSLFDTGHEILSGGEANFFLKNEGEAKNENHHILFVLTTPILLSCESTKDVVQESCERNLTSCRQFNYDVNEFLFVLRKVNLVRGSFYALNIFTTLIMLNENIFF